MDLDDGMRIVTSQGWLSATSLDFQRAILSGCDCRPLEVGASLQAGGEDHGEMIGLVRGILELRTILGPADTAIMHFAHPVFWLGFVPTLFKQPRRVAAAAKTRAWLVRVPEATIKRTLKENPQWWAFFLQPLLEYGDLTVTIAADLLIRDSERRCAAAQLRLAGRRYAGPQDVTPVEVPLTQNELAGAANLSRNSVGTMLRRPATRGFVEVGYGTMTVRTPAALRAFDDQG
jgi:CRP/FNR family transcriptional regulator, cyclic AMP receptor protein